MATKQSEGPLACMRWIASRCARKMTEEAQASAGAVVLRGSPTSSRQAPQDDGETAVTRASAVRDGAIAASRSMT